jgi:hypothetical protein
MSCTNLPLVLNWEAHAASPSLAVCSNTMTREEWGQQYDNAGGLRVRWPLTCVRDTSIPIAVVDNDAQGGSQQQRVPMQAGD